MCIGDAIFRRRRGIRSREAPKRRHCKREGHCAHHRAPATIALAGERAERGNFDNFRGERRSPVTQWPGHRHTAIVKARVRHNDGNPASTWLFDQGTLIVHHLGRTVPCGRYATPHTNSLRKQLRCTSPRTQPKRRTRLWQARLRARPPRSEWRADREFFKRADTAAGEYIDKIGSASASNLGAAMARWIKCAHQNC
jgi:hypothetical protein